MGEQVRRCEWCRKVISPCRSSKYFCNDKCRNKMFHYKNQDYYKMRRRKARRSKEIMKQQMVEAKEIGIKMGWIKANENKNES